MSITDLTRIPGAPQSVLTAAQLAELPDHSAPAPWTAEASALLWWQPPNRALAAAVDPRFGRVGPPLGVIGGLVRYRETAVGAYDEIFATVAYLTRRGLRTTTPFIAVNSPASLIGGRANWAIPKVLGEFTGDLDCENALACAGDRWSVRGTARPAKPSVPVRGGFKLAQIWPDDQVREAGLTIKGHGHPTLARIQVEAEPSLSDWFRSGTYPAMLINDFHGTISEAQ